MSKRTRVIILVSSAFLLIGIGLFGGIQLATNKKLASPDTLIPKNLSDKVSFPVYVPSEKSVWNIEPSKTSYDEQEGVLSLYLNHNNQQIILTQQATPQVFSDVPQQYSKMLSSMNQYAEYQTAFGAIGLTRPKELNGGQAAVVNKSGTLIFVKPNSDLSEDEWKNFFNNLRIYK